MDLSTLADDVREISPRSTPDPRLMIETLPVPGSRTRAKRLVVDVATALGADPLGTEIVFSTLWVTASMRVTEWLPLLATTTSGSKCALGDCRK